MHFNVVVLPAVHLFLLDRLLSQLFQKLILVSIHSLHPSNHKTILFTTLSDVSQNLSIVLLLSNRQSTKARIHQLQYLFVLLLSE